MIFTAFIVCAGGEGCANPVHLALGLVKFLEGAQGFFYDRFSAMMFHNLGQIAYAATGRLAYLTGGRRLKGSYQFQKRALPGAVLADKAYAIRLADMEVYIVQQCETPVIYCQIGYGNQDY